MTHNQPSPLPPVPAPSTSASFSYRTDTASFFSGNPSHTRLEAPFQMQQHYHSRSSSVSSFHSEDSFHTSTSYPNNNSFDAYDPASMSYPEPQQPTHDSHLSTSTSAPKRSGHLSKPHRSQHRSHHQGHTRSSSLANSDISTSSSPVGSYTSSSSFSPGGGAGAKKRISTARQARDDSGPYAHTRDSHSHSRERPTSASGRYEGVTPEEELAEMFGAAGMLGYGSAGSDWNEEDEDNRRDSLSSMGDWSDYDPGYSSSTSRTHQEQNRQQAPPGYGEFAGPEFEGPHGPTVMYHGGKNPKVIHNALAKVAGAIKEAGSGQAKDKARGAFVQAWLTNSYELCTEGNASRHALYGCYTNACESLKVKPINSAGFGKAVRQQFVDIKTRRLGVRGASRYHYCGIRPTHSEEAVLLVKLTKEEAGEDVSPHRSPGGDPESSGEMSISPGIARMHGSQSSSSSLQQLAKSGAPQPPTPTTARPSLPNSSSQNNTSFEPVLRHPSPRRPGAPKNNLIISVPPSRQSAFSAGTVSNEDRTEKTGGAPTAMPRMSLSGLNGPGNGNLSIPPPQTALMSFPAIEEALTGGGYDVGLDPTEATFFWREFSIHCQGLLDCVRNLRFDQFELNLRTWWTRPEMDARACQLVQNPILSGLVYRADAAIYDDILAFLNAQLLVPMIPSTFAALRGLGEHMEKIQTVALVAFEGLPFASPKIELAARFGHLLSRHVGLCQLAQALGDILSNPRTMHDLSAAWQLVDLESIKNQSALVSNCDHSLMAECFEGFNNILKAPESVAQIIAWVDACFERCLAFTTQNAPVPMLPRSLLLRWNYVISQIMRDLTLRSAATFGSFQIFSLFIEDLLGFQILRRVALHISASSPSSTQDQNVLSPSAMNIIAHYPIGLNSPLPLPQNVSMDQEATYSQTLVPFTSIDQFSPSTRQMFEALDKHASASSNMEELPYQQFDHQNYQPFSFLPHLTEPPATALPLHSQSYDYQFDSLASSIPESQSTGVVSMGALFEASSTGVYSDSPASM